MKRFFDLAISSCSLILSAPLWAAVALAIKLDSKGPVIFRQDRVGMEGRHFQILKFRTMSVGSDLEGHRLTLKNDPRVTRVGKVLRRMRLDELPQLLNVIRGEMSLVGPRPEMPEHAALLTEAERRVLNVRPGITSPASLEYLDESELLGTDSSADQMYAKVILPAKVRLNLRYLERASLLSDLGILWRTFLALGGKLGDRGQRQNT
jgi:lipopolysaccharide/colanic/teichoic acid biosynthesis glycosyltransferase